MCGRTEDQLTRHAQKVLEGLFGQLYGPGRYRAEVRPTDPQRVVRRLPDGQYELIDARWGLVPPRISSADLKKYALFNARVETLAGSRVFGAAFRTQRAVIPLSAFFEWTGEGGQKQKMRLSRPDGLPLLVAALWQRAEHEGQFVESCTIVTRPPTPDIKHVHDRMPALLLSRDLDAWLSGPVREAQAVAALSWPTGVLEVRAV